MSVYKNWDNESVFKDQLALNIRQLSSESEYPAHWWHFLTIIDRLNPSSIFDLGCGCGAFYALCKKHFPRVKYTGADFSENAIKIAKNTWNYERFLVKDLFNLSEVDISNYDVLHLGALLDVLDDGDAGLKHALSLECKNVIVGRVHLTEKESFTQAYKAYNKIDAIQFNHNTKNLLSVAAEYNYNVTSIENTILFQKNV